MMVEFVWHALQTFRSYKIGSIFHGQGFQTQTGCKSPNPSHDGPFEDFGLRAPPVSGKEMVEGFLRARVFRGR